MKKLGNVLYILTPDSYLYCQNDTIAVKVGGAEKVRIPSHTIESIVCFGNTTVSTPFIAFCAERNIGLSFLSEYGRFYGRVYGPASGNVLLRKKQYSAMDDQNISMALVKNILYGKIANSKNVLLRCAREQDSEEVKEKIINAANQITVLAQKIEDCEIIDSLRGIEGVIANTYFGVFDYLIKSDDENLRFEKRSRHPPENNVNSLLSFLYILLKNDVQCALESVGIDPAAGFLHSLRPGRPSMALDMMEELRAPLCDRLALSLINLKQIKADDFSQDEGGIMLSDKARRLVIDNWQKRKKEEIIHPFFNEKIPVGLIPYAQAQLLAKFFRGDIDAYPPFLWR